MNKLAQGSIDLFTGEYKGFGLFGLETQASSQGGYLLGIFVSRAIGIITVVAIIWFVFILITGAIGMIGAGGDKGAMEGARKKVTSGLIGLIVLISGIFVAQFVGAFLGIKDFLNPAILIDTITR